MTPTIAWRRRQLVAAIMRMQRLDGSLARRKPDGPPHRFTYTGGRSYNASEFRKIRFYARQDVRWAKQALNDEVAFETRMEREREGFDVAADLRDEAWGLWRPRGGRG